MAQYAQVYTVSAVSEARYNESVAVAARIKNIGSTPITMMARGALEYGVSPWPTTNFQDSPFTLNAGSLKWVTSVFQMPSHDVRFHVYTYWYGSDNTYHFDDDYVWDIDLKEVLYAFGAGIPTVSFA